MRLVVASLLESYLVDLLYCRDGEDVGGGGGADGEGRVTRESRDIEFAHIAI
jgi:hypothetical protein